MSHRAADQLDPDGRLGWLYDALPMQAVWRPRLSVDSYCLAG